MAHHQVFHPVAQLVDEQYGEVVYCLPKLNPGGLKHKSLKSVSDLSPWGTKYVEKLGHPRSIPPSITIGCILATGISQDGLSKQKPERVTQYDNSYSHQQGFNLWKAIHTLLQVA